MFIKVSDSGKNMESLVILLVIALGVTMAAPPNAENSNRIMGGFVSPENVFEYMISLQELSKIQDYKRGHRCGGALVSYQHALTAASCTFNNNNGALTPINVADFRVFAGSVQLTDDTSEDHVRSIASVTVHPSFLTSTPFADDIAVITLTVPFPSNVVKPVQLSVNDVGPTEFGACEVSGWGGQNVSATESSKLMYSIQTVYEWHACMWLYHNLPPSHQLVIYPSMICAYADKGTAAGCTGDVGNPLVCHDRLTGIAAKIQECSTTAFPEIYTRISSYTRWINQVVNSAPSTIQPGIALLAMFAVVAANIIA